MDGGLSSVRKEIGPPRIQQLAAFTRLTSLEVVVTAKVALDAAAEPRHDAYEALLGRCRELEPVITAVAYPCEQTTLIGVVEAA